jgi:3,4-dihydroxy 2-butanone 4-phosphate synthase/GTP cyclohydrolase II
MTLMKHVTEASIDSQFHSIAEVLHDFQSGKCVILVDDEDRENEGDLVLAAEQVTPIWP